MWLYIQQQPKIKGELFLPFIIRKDMYIMIELIKAYKYDNSYDYIKTFTSKADQTAYFNTYQSITLDDTDYIKEHEDFRVPINYDELVNDGVNYVIFNNGFRDLYAFILNKQYVNDEETKLFIEIDVIQTYMFDFNINKSFVARKKLLPSELAALSDFDEGLDIGEPIVEYNTKMFDKTATWFYMFNGIREQRPVLDADGKVTSIIDLPYYTQTQQTSIDGVLYPLYFVPIDVNGSDVRKMLNDHPNLVGIIRFPYCEYTQDTLYIPITQRQQDGTYLQFTLLVYRALSITSVPVASQGLSVTKNEVTDFFPYTYYVLSDGETQPLVLLPQYLEDSFFIRGTYSLSHQPVERYYPNNYKGDSSGVLYNITNTNQMMLPTATNEGMSYLNANANTMMQSRKSQITNAVIGGAATVVGAVLTDGVSLAFGGLQNLGNGLTSIADGDARRKDIMTTPDTISSFGTPSTRNAFNTDCVRVIKYTVKDSVKEKIRGFIERYGNKFNNYDTIDLKSYQGFIKFVAPNIDSKIDNFFILKLRQILERGVYVE
jgi:hypothetical protein